MLLFQQKSELSLCGNMQVNKANVCSMHVPTAQGASTIADLKGRLCGFGTGVSTGKKGLYEKHSGMGYC